MKEQFETYSRLYPLLDDIEYHLFVVYNHNDTVIGIHDDYGNAAEAALFYEEVTGNRTSIRVDLISNYV